MARIKALGVGTPEPPPQDPEEPPPQGPPPPGLDYQYGFAQQVTVPDRWEIVNSTVSLQDAVRSGYAATVPDGAVLQSVYLEVADGGAFRSINGATLIGRGDRPIARWLGRGYASNLLIRGRNLGSDQEDGFRAETGCNFWGDKIAFRDISDEHVDFWGPGAKRGTLTRSASLGDDGREYAIILGNSPDGNPGQVDQWLTLVDYYFESASRQPRVGAPGAVVHAVNTVHARWWAGAPQAMETAWGGVIIAQGPIFNRDNTSSGGVGAKVHQGTAGLFIDDPMRLVSSVSLQPSAGRPRPSLPYDPIPYSVAQGQANILSLARKIQNAAAPAFAPKQYAL